MFLFSFILYNDVKDDFNLAAQNNSYFIFKKERTLLILITSIY